MDGVSLEHYLDLAYLPRFLLIHTDYVTVYFICQFVRLLFPYIDGPAETAKGSTLLKNTRCTIWAFTASPDQYSIAVADAKHQQNLFLLALGHLIWKYQCS